MNEIETRLRIMFPRASQAFYDINSGLRAEKPEPASRSPLVNPAPGKESGDERIILRYVLYRVRLLDPDNAYGATKTLTDCLCQIGLLPGDAANQVEINVAQEKVSHYKDQKTTLHIQYP